MTTRGVVVSGAVLIAGLLVVVLLQHRDWDPVEEPPRSGAVVTIRDEPTCEGCRIELEREVTLGGREGDAILGDRSSVERSPTDEYLVVSAPDRHLIRVFDRDGRFTRAVGEQGEGPTEMLHASILKGGEERIYAADVRRRRLHVLTHGFEHLEEFEPEVWGQTWVVGDSLLVVGTAEEGTPERIGIPYHLMDMQGRVIRSFGELDGPPNPLTALAHRRQLHIDPDGMLWAVTHVIRGGAYQIERWTLDGEPLGRWRRQSDDLRGLSVSPPVSPDEPSFPRNFLASGVNSMMLDRDRLLWIFTTVPSPSWREGMVLRETGRWAYGNLNLLWDTVIDVIDPVAGTLVASRRIDIYVMTAALLDGEVPRVPSPRQDDLGYQFLDIWRVTLAGP